MRVLVVEDYTVLRENIVEHLVEAGYVVDASGNGAEGLWYAENHSYDVLVLDIMLPELDGLQLIKHLQSHGGKVPVIVISGRDSVANRIEGLDAGADDYLIKPFSLDELLARIRVQARRKYDRQGSRIKVGELEIDPTGRRVSLNNEEVELTRREYTLLEYLAHRSGEVVSRSEIWDHVYEDEEGGSSNLVDVYIGYLRKKLHAPGRPSLIHTRRGQGYLLE